MRGGWTPAFDDALAGARLLDGDDASAQQVQAGLLPKWVSSYFPVDKRAAGLGFCYNVGALGGAVGPVLGAAIADQLGLGMALAILSFGFAAIVMVSIGANVPRLLQKMVGPAYVRPEDGNDEIIKEG